MVAVIEGGHIPTAGASGGVAWATARKSKLPGEPCGDGYLIRWIGRSIVFAVADGSGSGPRAAQATATCLRAIEAAPGVGMEELFHTAHAALQGICGAALAIARLDPVLRRLSWASVGDVDATLVRGRPAPARRVAVIQRGGTIGLMMPSLAAQVHDMNPGDMLLISTDGVRRDFRETTSAGEAPDSLAGRILAEHGRETDDSLVLVAKFETAP